MAYESLKEQIAAAVYANGRQEIDAPDVREILQLMVEGLAEGYRIEGVATPSTTPEPTDKRIAYFATTAGTYAGFGGIVLDAGHSALLVKTESGWQAVELGLMPGVSGAITTDLLANAAVTAEKVADNAIKTAKIEDGAITADKIASNAILTAKLANSAVTTDKIEDGAVEAAKIGSNAVTMPKIMDGSVTADKLGSGSVSTAKIANHAVTRNKIADAAISAVKIDVNAVTAEKIANGSVTTAKINDAAVESSKIAANAVTTEKIAAAAVSHIELANDAVESNNIKNEAVGTAKIVNSSVTAAKIANAAVTAEKVADNAIGTSNIVDGSITADKLAANSVTSEKIAAGAVIGTKLAANAVTASKIASGSVSLEKLGEDVADTFGDLYLTKVDKDGDKVLSTNDYTDDEKEKLAALPTNAELNEDFAKNDGYYETLGAGYARSLLGTGASVPAEFTARPAGGTADIASGVATLKDIKGNTVVWNQMVYAPIAAHIVATNATYTIDDGVIKVTPTSADSYSAIRFDISKNAVSGHIYAAVFYAKAETDDSVAYQFRGFNLNASKQAIETSTEWKSYCVRYSASSTEGNINFFRGQGGSAYYLRNMMFFDLTQMFGAGNEPASVAEFRALFPNSYPYNAGELLSLTAENLVTDGFNAFDKATGKARVLALTPSAGQAGSYQITGSYTSITQDGEAVTPDSNGFFTPKEGEVVVVGGDDTTCIHIVHSGTRNGDYEPHWQESKSLNLTTIKGKLNGEGESVTIFPEGMRSAGTAYDELIVENGNIVKAVKRIGAVKAKTVNWQYIAGTWGCFTVIIQAKKFGATNLITANYDKSAIYNTDADKAYYGNDNSSAIYIRDNSFGGDVTSFKNHFADEDYIYYQLATPQTYTLDEPVSASYRVDDFGTESIEPLTDEDGNPATAPMQADIVYGPNVQDAIRRMPTLYLSIADYKAGIGNLATALGTSLDKTIAVEWGGENDSVPTFTITDNA